MTRVDLTALPPKARAVIYYVYVVVGLGLGSTQVGYSAARLEQPVWLTVSFAVFGFLATGLGLVAASNTPTGVEAGEAAVAPVQEPVEAEVSPVTSEGYVGEHREDTR